MMKKNKKIQPEPSSTYNTPSPVAALSPFHLEANRHSRGIRLMISGIIGISDFTDERVALATHGGKLTVAGSSLELCIYENGTASISGKVTDIGFSYGRGRRGTNDQA